MYVGFRTIDHAAWVLLYDKLQVAYSEAECEITCTRNFYCMGPDNWLTYGIGQCAYNLG